MAENQIRLVVEPPHSEVDADVSADAFVNQFRALLDALDRSERIERGANRLEWVVQELSSRSPKRAVLVPRYRSPDVTPGYVAEVERRFFDTVDLIQSGHELPPDLRRSDIEVFKKLGAQVRAGRLLATVTNASRSISIEKELDLRAEVALAPEVHAVGETQGRVGLANVHHAHHFYLYPWVGPTRIRCEFKADHTSEVGKALGEWVTVRGTHVYPARSAHPETIYVTGVVPLEDPEGAPTIFDLRGIGGRQSEDTLGGEATDEW